MAVVVRRVMSSEINYVSKIQSFWCLVHAATTGLQGLTPLSFMWTPFVSKK